MSTAVAQQAANGKRKYLSFTLNGEAYALAIEQVREIIEFGQVTSVPMMPPTMRGVINLRGAVVPVVDLSRRFGAAPSGVGRRTCIVILDLPLAADAASGPQTVGVIVDAVNAVLDIAPEDIEPPPDFGLHIRTDFILGMGKVKGRFVVILNLQRALAADEIAVVASLAQPGNALLRDDVAVAAA